MEFKIIQGVIFKIWIIDIVGIYYIIYFTFRYTYIYILNFRISYYENFLHILYYLYKRQHRVN